MIIDLYGFGPALAAGALMTVKLALTALCLGLVLGLLGALAKTSPYKPLQWLGGTYSTLVRGVPELLWVLLIYFGTVNLMRSLGEFFGNPDLQLSAFAAGVIALGLCFGAYATEVFRGAILAIPKGHREAGVALGLSKWRIFTKLIMPQMWRIALPGLGNLFMILMKDTALVSVIGLDNIVVVETKDAMMIAHKDKVQGVKQMVNTLNEQGRSETQNHCEVYRPWGSYDSVDMGGRFQVKHISVKPGACLSLQMHHHRAEHWIVVSGTAEVTCDENVFLLCENQSTYIPIASVHRLRNPGKIPLEIIEVQSGSYLGEDDIERFEDIYGRSTPIERGVSVKTIAQ